MTDGSLYRISGDDKPYTQSVAQRIADRMDYYGIPAVAFQVGLTGTVYLLTGTRALEYQAIRETQPGLALEQYHKQLAEGPAFEIQANKPAHLQVV
ncbi:MAG: hypothetical protein VKJ06_00770 [Vampirovibrionales bacterium]|nr:hypothetical protein [Vampirovibrionales bacterium]